MIPTVLIFEDNSEIVATYKRLQSLYSGRAEIQIFTTIEQAKSYLGSLGQLSPDKFPLMQAFVDGWLGPERSEGTSDGDMIANGLVEIGFPPENIVSIASVPKEGGFPFEKIVEKNGIMSCIDDHLARLQKNPELLTARIGELVSV